MNQLKTWAKEYANPNKMRAAVCLSDQEMEEMAFEAGALKYAEELQKSSDITKDSCVGVIMEWKTFWMNQKQNNDADYKNYLHRAIGVDANMKYHLADLFFEHFLPVLSLIQKLKSDNETNANVLIKQVQIRDEEISVLKAQLEKCKEHVWLLLGECHTYTEESKKRKAELDAELESIRSVKP